MWFGVMLFWSYRFDGDIDSSIGIGFDGNFAVGMKLSVGRRLVVDGTDSASVVDTLAFGLTLNLV